jgi:hypothetical protein
MREGVEYYPNCCESFKNNPIMIQQFFCWSWSCKFSHLNCGGRNFMWKSQFFTCMTYVNSVGTFNLETFQLWPGFVVWLTYCVSYTKEEKRQSTKMQFLFIHAMAAALHSSLYQYLWLRCLIYKSHLHFWFKCWEFFMKYI